MVLIEESPSFDPTAVIANSMMAAPAAHPFLGRLLRGTRPSTDIFRSSGSHLLQVERCVLAHVDDLALTHLMLTTELSRGLSVHVGCHMWAVLRGLSYVGAVT